MSPSRHPSRCPLDPEIERIRNKHPILASTGCTKEFCQSGRMTHTDEPRGTCMPEALPPYECPNLGRETHPWNTIYFPPFLNLKGY